MDVLSGSKPRGESGVLLVPVLPGAAIRSVPLAEEREPTAQRVLPVALALAGVLAFVAAAIVLFDRAFSKTQRASAPPASVTAPTHAVVPHPAPAPRRAQQRPQQRARSTALHLAAGLPVELESTALLRVGSKLYAVGGTERSGLAERRHLAARPSYGPRHVGGELRRAAQRLRFGGPRRRALPRGRLDGRESGDRRSPLDAGEVLVARRTPARRAAGRGGRVRRRAALRRGRVTAPRLRGRRRHGHGQRARDGAGRSAAHAQRISTI